MPWLGKNPIQHRLFLYRQLNTVCGDMIQIRCMTVTLLLACGAFQAGSREARDILFTMLSHIVDYPICLCKSLIRATRTFEVRRILFRVSGGNMKG